MKLWIGCSDAELNNTLKFYLTQRNWHLMQSGNYHLIRLPRTSLQQFSQELSAILSENIIPQILMKTICTAAPDLSAKEKETVLLDTIHQLSQKGLSKTFFRDLTDRILLLTYESDILTIDGFIYFRCRDLLGQLQNLLEQTLEEYLSAKEKHRLLSVLRRYSEQRTPQIPFLKIYEKNSEFLFYDSLSQRILTVFSEEYTPEEHLLNTLLYLSPAVIDISEMEHPELRVLLEEIFPGRIQK